MQSCYLLLPVCKESLVVEYLRFLANNKWSVQDVISLSIARFGCVMIYPEILTSGDQNSMSPKTRIKL